MTTDKIWSQNSSNKHNNEYLLISNRRQLHTSHGPKNDVFRHSDVYIRTDWVRVETKCNLYLIVLSQKTATAVAHCKRGNGLIKVNGRPLEMVEPATLQYKVSPQSEGKPEHLFSCLSYTHSSCGSAAQDAECLIHSAAWCILNTILVLCSFWSQFCCWARSVLLELTSESEWRVVDMWHRSMVSSTWSMNCILFIC